MNKRKVTEQDFRLPEFRDANPDDYEFRDDGKIVRKDRWKTGVQNISAIINGPRFEFEIPDVVKQVRDRQSLWELCEEFIREQDIGCVEKIHQTDSVIENAYTFIENICYIVGYSESEEDE